MSKIVGKVWALLFGMSIGFGWNPSCRAAEQVFTDDVRIQKDDPNLILDNTSATPKSFRVTAYSDSLKIGTTDPLNGFVQPFSLTNGGLTVGVGDPPNPAAYLSDNFLEVVSSGYIPSPSLKLSVRNGLDYEGLPLGFDSTWFLRCSPGNSGFTGFELSQEGTNSPIQVELGSPTNVLYLANNGSGMVGVGTSTPEKINNKVLLGDVRHLNLNAGTGVARLIAEGQTAAEMYLVHSGGLTGRKVVRTRVGGGKYQIGTLVDNLSANIEPAAFSIDLTTTNVGIKTVNPVKPLQVGDAGANDGNGAHVTSGGVWTNASSRTVKQDIEPITTQQARDTVRALQPVGYRYKNELDEKYVGFIAEDVPELVATNDRKSLAAMDVVAVLTRVVQDQDRLINEGRETNAEQKQALDRQLKALEQQQKTVAQQQQLIARQQELLESLSKRLAEVEQKQAE